MVTRTLLAASVLMLAVQSTLASTIIYVDAGAAPPGDGASWASAFTDLQDALAHAATLTDDDVQIWIAAGVYTPGTPEDGPEATFNLVSGVALYGGFAGGEASLEERDWEKYETTLSGSLNGVVSGGPRVFNVLTGADLGEGTRLDGIIVREGAAWEWASSGGGLALMNSSLLIANATFIDNDAEVGGAIHAIDSHLTLTNTRFISNFAYDAGAIRAESGSLHLFGCEFIDQQALEIGGAIWTTGVAFHAEKTDFHDNIGPGLGFAGAAALGNTDATFIDCTFTGNFSHGPSTLWVSGSLTLDGCVFNQNGTGGYTVWGNGSLQVVDTTFTYNDATPITWSAGSNEAAIIRSTFLGNSCGGSKCGVGGVEIGAALITIEESVFHDNASTWGGNLVIGANDAFIRNTRITAGPGWGSTGGLQFGGGSLTVINTLVAGNQGGVALSGSANATFINCTIIDNPGHATANHAGIFIGPGAHVEVHNTILWGNAEGDEAAQISGPASVFHSIVQGLDAHAGTNNLGDDPMFADADGRLSERSPAIDAGDNTAFPSHIEQVDLDGNPRIVDGTGDGIAVVDIGAFEFQTTPGIPGDLNGDGVVDVFDLLTLLAAWGKCDDCSDCPADLDGDCNVDVPDLLILLSNWS